MGRCANGHMGNLVGFLVKPLVIQAKANSRIESPKIRNRRMRRKVLFYPVDVLYSVSDYVNLAGFLNMLIIIDSTS